MPIVILDYKKKRKASDSQWNDPLGLDETRQAKINTIEIDKKTDNIIEKFLLENTPKMLMGKRIWAYSKKKNKYYTGYIRDVYPLKVLLVRVNGENVPVYFADVIAMEA